jgi:histidinol dehydrogenase
MKIIIEPSKSDYKTLSRRPQLDNEDLSAIIQGVYERVGNEGDQALLDLTRSFDKVALNQVAYLPKEIQLEPKLKSAIDQAYSNIYAFHKAQWTPPVRIETMSGILCEQRSVAIDKVGIYIPGGSAPLFSTVLMLAIPAKIAGCKEIIMCTPPNHNLEIHPVIAYCADLCGVNQIYSVGGAQAIAAMVLGTESIPAVDKIFGPGNQYVTAAKMMAMQYGVSIDMPAGPSEVLVYADETADADFVAADLIAQAEHGADSQVILVCDSEDFAQKVISCVDLQLIDLPRKQIAVQALGNSKAIIIADLNAAFDFINIYAPEHLIIASDRASDYLDKVKNAGSVFLGNYTPESLGDYASGTNHTLPTNGWARSYSGVNLDAYSKKMTIQSATPKGLKNIASTVVQMAKSEQLDGHARAVTIRQIKK